MKQLPDPVLDLFKAALNDVYGERLERAVLYGSRARGDNRPDSDYDVAVFLKDYKNFGQEIDRLGDITLDILEATGAVINPLPYDVSSLNKRTVLMNDIRNEGVCL